MKVKCLGASIFLSAALLIGSSAAAEEIYSIDYNPENSWVTISGTAEKAGAEVTLELLAPGVSSEDIKEASVDELRNLILHTDEKNADENRQFVFEFKIPEKYQTNTYIIRINTNDDSVQDSTLVYISYTEYRNAFDAVNRAKNKEKMAEAIENGKKYLGIDVKYYNDLKYEEKLNLADGVIAARGNQEFSDIKDFLSAVKINTAVQAVNHSNDGSYKASDVFDYYNDVFMLEKLDVYEAYEQLDSNSRDSVMDAVSKRGGYVDIKQICDAYTEYTILYSVYTASGYDRIYPLLYANRAYLNIDFSEFNSLQNKSNITRQIVGVLFKDCKTLAERFDELVKAEKRIVSGVSGGNSAGGRGGSNTVSIPPYAVVPTSETGEILNTNEPKFKDIESVEWAKDSITALAKERVIDGKTNDMFFPNDFITREEFIKILVNALGIYDSEAECEFSDVGTDKWFYRYIATAAEKNIVKGMDDGIFGVGVNITRQDMAVIIARAMGNYVEDLSSDGKKEKFADEADVAEYAKNAVEYLHNSGLVQGNNSNEFKPMEKTTRAEAAVVIYKLLNRKG